MARDDAAEKRRVTIALSDLAFEALAGGKGGVDASLRMENALLCYLGDRDSDRPAWGYPGFLRGSETRQEAEVELEVRASLWRDFEAEAVRQGVTVEQLAEQLKVSPRSIHNAKKVLAKGAPELVTAVEEGKLPVAAAATIADKPREQQAAAVEERKARKAKGGTNATPP